MQRAKRLSSHRGASGPIWTATTFFHGLVRAVEIIGEAASRVSAETRAQYPGIPWKAIIGTRNKVIHDYVSVDHDILWDTVQVDLPGLIAQLEEILSEPDNPLTS
jgi:uncharacterized protein with HEPN domain